MSDLSILVGVIERIERTRQAHGAPLQSQQLQRQALEFYQSQGIEVDHQLVEAACLAEVNSQTKNALSPNPEALPLGPSEKRFRFKALAGAALCLTSVVSAVVFHDINVDVAIGIGALSLSGCVLLTVMGLDSPYDQANARALMMWQGRLTTATTSELLVLNQHPKLNDYRRHDVHVELHRRGLSPAGRALLT